MAKATYTFRQFVIHAILLAGCAVFAFPFVWLLSTSAKTNEELGVFPPRWVPAVPWYAEQSPFVDGAAYDAMEPPRDMTVKEWEELHGEVEKSLWRRIEAMLGAERQGKVNGGIAVQFRFGNQMIRGVWSQVRDIVPDKPAPAQFRAFVDKAVTPAMVDRCWDRIVRRLAVRDVEVRHTNDDIVPPREVEPWEGGGPATLTADTVEGKPAAWSTATSASPTDSRSGRPCASRGDS